MAKKKKKKLGPNDFDFVGNYEAFPKKPKNLKLGGAILHTAGNGLWSTEERKVKVQKASMRGFMPEFPGAADLRVKFSTKTWDTDKLGLIYTDRLWLRELRKLFVNLGFSEKAAKEVDYSEQGMQGDNYVSLDVGKYFLKEWRLKGLTVGEFK